MEIIKFLYDITGPIIQFIDYKISPEALEEKLQNFADADHVAFTYGYQEEDDDQYERLINATVALASGIDLDEYASDVAGNKSPILLQHRIQQDINDYLVDFFDELKELDFNLDVAFEELPPELMHEYEEMLKLLVANHVDFGPYEKLILSFEDFIDKKALNQLMLQARMLYLSYKID